MCNSLTEDLIEEVLFICPTEPFLLSASSEAMSTLNLDQ